MNKISSKFIKITQPIGEFYMLSIKAKDIVLNLEVLRRKDNKEYVQRDDNKDRIKNIANYCKDPDLTFPTPIIVSVNSEKVTINESQNTISYEKDTIIGDIVDGQHRTLGIKKAINENFTDGDFDLIILFMFDLEPWEKAYIFSTVNHNQKQVDTSLIYDLFSLIKMKYRSPVATCHILAKTFNNDEKSPFYRNLKMLGKKINDEELLSQGTFVKNILKYLISKTPQDDELNIKRGIELKDNSNLPLREYFISNADEDIYQILLNYFNAVKKVYHETWDNHDEYLLKRSIGFGALTRIFADILHHAYDDNDLREDYFKNILTDFKNSGVDFKLSTQTSGGLETKIYKEMKDILDKKFDNNQEI